jgi:Nucleoside-diphosphate-sugar epimerases
MINNQFQLKIFLIKKHKIFEIFRSHIKKIKKKNDRILVTGSKGLLGSALVGELKKQGFQKIYKLNRKVCDLENKLETNKTIKKINPHYLFHCANKVYGIKGNSKNKFEMININNIINSNVLNAIKNLKIKKIIAIGSSAAYPNLNKILNEEDFLKKEPHSSEFYYGISKRDLYYQLQALSESKNIKFNYVIMNNLYGIEDNFDIDNGHVIPALIHKCYLSKKFKKEFKVLGKINDKRNFLNSIDAARALIIIAKCSNENLINLGSKNEI